MNRELLAEINLSSIAHNLNIVKRITEGLPVIAVVKADAYGHGAILVSKVFEKGGVFALAVAFREEAIELRETGIKSPILVLFGASASKGSEIRSFFDLNLTPVIHDLKTAKTFSKEAQKQRTTIDIHIKADTGMGRMGFNNMKDIIKAISLSNIKVRGVMSHFSDADLSDKEYALGQLRMFQEIRKTLFKNDIKPFSHIANSAALLGLKESYLDGVRPGLALYGCLPFAPDKGSVEKTLSLPTLRPAMTVSTRVLALRRIKKGQPVSYGRTFITTHETLTAVLPIGYADGYSRSLSNNSSVILKGKKAPVIGRICMDLTVVDVTHIKGVKVDDKAIILGSDGKETITPWDIAQRAGTIPYEVFTSLGSRAKRVYVS